jgi:hypothetical protein
VYNSVAVLHNPVHPEVQEAANALIECLIFKRDFEQAETFAQLTLDSLKDPANGLDQQSESVAIGYYNLANVISRIVTGDLENLLKAETMVRESLRIVTRLYSTDHLHVGECSSLLAFILMAQGNLGCETRQMFERSLQITTKRLGPDGVNTSVLNASIGELCIIFLDL